MSGFFVPFSERQEKSIIFQELKKTVDHLTALVLLCLDFDISFSENGVDPDQLASGQDSASPIFCSKICFCCMYRQYNKA